MNPEPEIQQKFDILSRELMSSSLVNEVTRVMLSAPTFDRVLEAFFLGITEITGIQRMAIFTVRRKEFELVPIHHHGVNEAVLVGLSLSLEVEKAAHTRAIFQNRHIITDRVGPDDSFRELDSQSYICMPIVSRITQRCWEVRQCGKTSCPCYQGSNPYCWAVPDAAQDTGARNQDERRRICVECSQFKCEALLWLDTSVVSSRIMGAEIAHLTNLAYQAGMVMETFNMYGKLEEANKSLADNNRQLASLNCALNQAHKRLETELDHARSIQSNLLPDELPKHLFRDIASVYVPAGKVGGDYYDCFEIGTGKLGFIVADVAGHGIGAALVMSMFKVLLKTYAESFETPAAVLEQINRTFLREVRGSHFVTSFFGIFHKETRKLTYCSAGHNPQILCHSDGMLQDLQTRGLFVGVFDDTLLEDKEAVLEPGSRLVLYTDGITEAQNDGDEFFGLENLKQLVVGARDLDARELQESVDHALSCFRGKRELADDYTLVILDL